MSRMAQTTAVGVLALLWGTFVPATAFADLFDVSRQREIELGREVAGVIEKHAKVDTDPVLAAKVQRIGHRLVEVCDRRDLPYEFHVIQDDEVNAFSLPGGFLYFYTGLLNVLPSDEAIAFVIGHEMAHAAKRHYAREYEKLMRLSVLTLGYANVVGIFLELHYSRRYEHEADYYGMLWEAKAGFAPEGGPQAMRALLALLGRDEGISFLRTHPPTKDRLSRLESQIAKVNEIVASGRPDEPPDLSDLPEVEDVEPQFPELAASDLAPNELWPLGAGATWVYESRLDGAGPLRRTVTVEEELPGETKGVYRLRTSLGPGLDALSLIATTARRVLTRPTAASADAQWQVEWVTDLDGAETQTVGDAAFARTQESVTVPFGTFDAVRVEKRHPADNAVMAVAWFAPGVGLVKLSHPGEGLAEVLIAYHKPPEARP